MKNTPKNQGREKSNWCCCWHTCILTTASYFQQSSANVLLDRCTAYQALTASHTYKRWGEALLQVLYHKASMLLPPHNSRLKDCTVPMEILGISHNSSSYCLYSVGSISPIDTTAVDVASSYNNCSKIETLYYRFHSTWWYINSKSCYLTYCWFKQNLIILFHWTFWVLNYPHAHVKYVVSRFYAVNLRVPCMYSKVHGIMFS